VDLSLPPGDLTRLPEWLALAGHRSANPEPNLARLFAEDSQRAQRLSVEHEELLLDYSKNLVTDETLALLTGLARARGLPGQIEKLFAGARVNSSENRAAFHVALRAPRGSVSEIEGNDVGPQVQAVLARMADFSERVRSGEWKGQTGKRIRHVVNIGIGGSDLGPRMALRALRPYASADLRVDFLANLDGADFAARVEHLDPAETLFVVCSKTFNTEETLANARLARDWLVAALGEETAVARHFAAATANVEAAAHFGIDPALCFEFWDWVGGRYSLASSVGLCLMLAVGPEAFRAMLAGMHAMDSHFRRAPLEANMPVLLGLLVVWYTGFLAAETHCIAPYSQDLAEGPAYLPQWEMERTGTGVGAGGGELEHHTAPIVWGQSGTRGQHAFFQLLHQGTRRVPVDFIGFARSHNPVADHHDRLMAHCFAQSEALAFGHADEPHRACPGNRPSNTLLAPLLTPGVLGQLVALYEHKVFVQATLWGVNPFDQWGVELGKKNARQIFSEIEAGSAVSPNHDGSTRALIQRYLAERRGGD
jgi:glucose-6-phosphate isomerase